LLPEANISILCLLRLMSIDNSTFSRLVYIAVIWRLKKIIYKTKQVHIYKTIKLFVAFLISAIMVSKYNFNWSNCH